MTGNETKMLRLMRLIATPDTTLSAAFLSDMSIPYYQARQTLESLIEQGKVRIINRNMFELLK